MMDIQMAAGANRDPDSRSGFTIEKVQQFLRLVHVAWASVMGMIILVGIVAFVILMMIHERSTWVVWFLLSMFASLCWCFQQLWSQFWHAIHVGCNVQLHVQSSGKNKYLVQALSELVRSKHSLHNEALVDIHTAEDVDTGCTKYQLILCPVNGQYRVRVTRAGDERSRNEITRAIVDITSTQREAVVCGPRHEVVQPLDFHLCSTSSSMYNFLMIIFRCNSYEEAQRLSQQQDCLMTFLLDWLQDVYINFTRTHKGHVTVMALVNESKDWGPQWEKIRESPAVNQSSGYHAADWAQELLLHGEFAIKRSRTAFFLHGKKGSGKTLFVEYLASELNVPIYYIDLTASYLEDSVLQDAITQRMLKHDLPVIFHIDEFQAIMHSWTDGLEKGSADVPSSKKVTIHGLQNVMEGIATPSKSLFIFTSSVKLPDLQELQNMNIHHRQEWEGLLRRMPVQKSMPLVNPDDAKIFFDRFLSQYVGSNIANASIPGLVEPLIQCWKLKEQPAPFDMLAKYAEQQLRCAYAKELIVSGSVGSDMRVPLTKKDSFLEFFFDHDAYAHWLQTYAGGSHACTHSLV